MRPDGEPPFPTVVSVHGGPNYHNTDAFEPRRQAFADCEVLLDAQVCVNTPVLRAASSVRGPHVDKPNKLFAGLYYLRPPGDTTTVGGELQLYRYPNPRAHVDGAELGVSEGETVALVEEFDPSVLGSNPLAAWRGTALAAIRAFAKPGALAEPPHDLAVGAKLDPQHPVRRRVLRPHVEDHLVGVDLIRVPLVEDRLGGRHRARPRPCAGSRG